MKVKLRQIGRNVIISYQNTVKTITVDADYDVNILFSLAQKVNQDYKIAERLFWKEVSKFVAPVIKNQEIINTRIERKLISKQIREIQSFDYESLPVFIPEDWKKILDSKQNSEHIKNFLMWLSLCDSKYTRNNFLRHFNTKYCHITPKGFIACVRQMWKIGDNNKLYDFIQSMYVKVKTSWKKSPSNYYVLEEKGGYSISKSDEGKVVGKLDDLFLNYKPSKKNTYTSNYNRNNLYIHPEVWSVGDVVTIPDKAKHGKICGIGQYHFLQDPLDVLTGIHGNYGDTIALCLINPARLISIEQGWKFTTDSFYFAAVMDEKDIEQQFNEQWGLFDMDYLEDNIEEMKKSLGEEKIKTKKQQGKHDVSQLKVLKNKLILGNETEHIEPKIYSEILKNRIQLLN